MTERSFSKQVRSELERIANTEKHCRAAAHAASEVFTSAGKGTKIERTLLKRKCCKRAFVREAFLHAGTVNAPDKAYHLEWDMPDEESAGVLAEALFAFDITPQISRRGLKTLVYLKESAQIALCLNVMGAHKSLMELENSMILKEMRGRVNRRVNCDAYNITKTVGAAAAQTEAIRHLKETGRLQTLPKPLREAAELRLKKPEATIAELAALMKPPLTKSGMNHRLHRLMSLGEVSAGHKGGT